MTTTATNTDDSHDYLPFLHAHREHFSRTIEGVKALFTTDAADLFATFLANLPPDQRQHHTCQACRHFVERFGDLVTIDEAGHTTPAMWGAAPEERTRSGQRPANPTRRLRRHPPRKR